METMVKYPSLLGERMEARIHYGSGHTSMGTVVINPIFEMDSNIATTKTSYNKPYQVFRNWKEWRNGEERIQSWYKEGTYSGVGLYGENQRYKVYDSPGSYTMVFQTEVYAMQTCALQSLRC